MLHHLKYSQGLKPIHKLIYLSLVTINQVMQAQCFHYVHFVCKSQFAARSTETKFKPKRRFLTTKLNTELLSCLDFSNLHQDIVSLTALKEIVVICLLLFTTATPAVLFQCVNNIYKWYNITFSILSLT